ncbi:MAG: helicase-exonuclease AddAB subunit AddA [Epulopiscium sp. Nele67-Bin005]|nr:MAG: helicase-exonuclease AddAB subunit AddA [Epulopiscium sp. Nele67-Bin005]
MSNKQIKRTPSQQIAIDIRDKNVLVSAAAGSGKTSVLTERVFKRILGNEEENPIEIDRFLVVTFTNSAAAEMKERIAHEITQAKDTDKTLNKKQISYLEQQLNILPKASISTIHSFCLKLIKTYFNQLDVDPNIHMGKEAELSLIQIECAEKVIEKAMDNEDNEVQEKFLEVAKVYASTNSLKDLVNLILKIYTYTRSTVAPLTWLDEKVDLLQQSNFEPYNEIILGQVNSEIKNLIQLCNEGALICVQPSGPEGYLETIKSDKSALESVDLSTLETIAQGFQTIQLQTLKRTKKDCDPHLKTLAKGIRDTVKKGIENLKTLLNKFLDEILIEKTTQSGSLIAEVVNLVKQFEIEYSQAKRLKGIVDFNDLEHFAIKLLLGKDEETGDIIFTDVAKELSLYYKEIYIDEYQDSNNVQEVILGAIANATSHGPTQFMVGDMKQSIYRFRLANPQIFAGKYESWDKINIVDDKPEIPASQNVVIDLSENFRSRDIVLNATNDVFNQLMSKEVGDLTYDDKAKLKVGNFYEKHLFTYEMTEDLLEAKEKNLLSDKIEVLLMENVKQSENEEETELEELSNIELEAHMVARKIKALTEKCANPQKIFCKDNEGNPSCRNVEPKDIVILLRSKKAASIFEEVLSQYKITAYAEVNAPFFEAIEVQILMSMLQIIDNPLQDIPLIAVLRSPIVGLSFDELLNIRNFNPDVKFYHSMKFYQEQNNIQVIQSFLDMLDKFRYMQSTVTVEELLNRIYTETGYYNYVGTLEGGTRRQANLRLLKQYAKDYEENSHAGLFYFVYYLSRLKLNNSKLEQAKVVGDHENAVQIMTIHKSKGLEFPIVFVSQTHTQFNKQDLREKVLLHNKLGIGAKFFDVEEHIVYETLPFIAIKNQLLNENISEELRILYVALTRAKEKLFITGVIKGNQEKTIAKWVQLATREEGAISAFNVKKANCYLNWIGMSMLASSNIHQTIQNIGIEYDKPNFSIKGNWHLEFTSPKMLAYNTHENSDNFRENAQKLLEQNPEEIFSTEEERTRIFAKLNAEYNFEGATLLPHKTSVTALKKELLSNIFENNVGDLTKVDEAINKEESDTKPIPKFLQKEEVTTIKGALRGTIIHNVFEQLDYLQFCTAETIKTEVERLVQIGKLHPDTLNLIDYDILEKFSNSEPIIRMKNSQFAFKEKSFIYLINANEIYENCKEEHLILQGIIDAGFIENDEIIIIDYKTDRVDLNNKNASIEKIKLQYCIQLEYYAQALASILKKGVKQKYIYLYNINEWIEV